jgi:betaine lipid synthase
MEDMDEKESNIGGQTPTAGKKMKEGIKSGHAVYEYVLNTFEPVVTTTLLSTSNHYYLLTLLGHYTPTCHPTYLSPKSHLKLSRQSPNPFAGLRIHTDEISEVIARMRPSTLTIVVVMDSMDWFPREGKQAVRQIRALNRALKVKGRVMLRSAGVRPWYVSVFEEQGFVAKRVAVRVPGACIDRYVSAFFLWENGRTCANDAIGSTCMRVRGYVQRSGVLYRTILRRI